MNLTTSTRELIINEAGADPQISPDERRLAYVGRSPAGPVIHVRPYPDVNRTRWTVSAGTGTSPRWSRDGRELFYVSGTEVLSVPIDAGGDLPARAPQVILRSPSPILGFAVHPVNTRFLLLHPTKEARATPRVVVNWLQTRNRPGSTGAGSR